MSTRKSTPQKKQFPLSANIFAIIIPKDNINHQALQIPDSEVANVFGLSLSRVIHSRPPKPINVLLLLSASYSGPTLGTSQKDSIKWGRRNNPLKPFKLMQ